MERDTAKPQRWKATIPVLMVATVFAPEGTPREVIVGRAANALNAQLTSRGINDLVDMIDDTAGAVRIERDPPPVPDGKKE